ncbi:hypothetical protein QYM36_019211, partial [Artemia franciscana]
MEHKEFCLTWNNYLDVFHGAFLSLLNSEHFTDVTLSCDSQSIKCHRLVLSCCSSYFETLLLGISHPHPVIILKDVKFDDLLSLVKFMYVGEVTVPQAQTSSLIKVAEMLKVKGLTYPNETVNQTQKHSYPSQTTQPATERNRVDTTLENNSSSNLEPPVAYTSNDKLINYPAETSSSAYDTDNAACSSMINLIVARDSVGVAHDDENIFVWRLVGDTLKLKVELIAFFLASSRMRSIYLDDEFEETFPDFSEDILSTKDEDISLVVSPAVSEHLNGNVKSSEFPSNILENE